MMAPNITNPVMNPTPEAELKVRSRKRSSGMIGSGTFVSTMQKATSTVAPTAASPMMGAELQRYCVPPQVVIKMIAVTPADSSEVPTQSILCGTRRVGRCRTAPMANRATIPMGTLM